MYYFMCWVYLKIVTSKFIYNFVYKILQFTVFLILILIHKKTGEKYFVQQEIRIFIEKDI